MHIRILDLDGSVAQQPCLSTQSDVRSAQNWGPSIRMACSFGRFRRFEQALSKLLGDSKGQVPSLIFIGSGDFHHVSLALLRRLRRPFNLLILDNHPDWMRGVPFMHCGTWVYHASRLPHLGRIFHVGGDVDFDNYYQWMAPWSCLRSGKIKLLPGRRPFVRSGWRAIPNTSLRPAAGVAVTPERVELLLQPFRAELGARPLYISLDKDVMRAEESAVNWDSGHLTLAEVQRVLRAFIQASGRQLAGMDIVGDWSPVRLRGWLRYLMHLTEHPALSIGSANAARVNEQTNLALIDCVQEGMTSESSRRNAS